MKAWVVERPGPLSSEPLRVIDRDVPEPGPGELLVKVSTCGVCRTDLHLVEGDLPPRRPRVTPGHEVVGIVVARGGGVSRFAEGDRVGIAWLRATCGRCRFCVRGDENLCLEPRFTGWDEDGGYAEYATVPEAFAHRLPEAFDDVHAAPLLCSGIIGYRALKRAALPPGGRLGIYGFGGSAHIALQVARHQGASVHVMTRGERARALAVELGADSVQSPDDDPPEPLDAAILFAPVGDLVPRGLAALDRGGRLSVAGIHLTPVPQLDYEGHLFYERELVSVTANTRADAREFLAIADEIPIRVSAQVFAFSEADRALEALSSGDLTGAAVLEFGAGTVEP